MSERREKLRQTAEGFASQSIGLLPALLLVRLFEVIASRSDHLLPAGLGEVFAHGVVDDLWVTCATALVLVAPILLVGSWSVRAARILHRAALAALVLAAVVLAKYFSITFVPVGADLFGYWVSDLLQTTVASGADWTAALALVVALAGVLALQGLVGRILVSLRRARTLGVAALAVLLIGPLFRPTPDRFDEEAAYFLAVDKLSFLAGKTLAYVTESLETSSEAFAEFPWLAPPSAEDVLGPHLSQADRPPNLVFVIVAGMGRDFVGPGAEYGGFTPFLDSLTQRSLYWENFLSNAGRTFGVLPSLLASLPATRGGFMELDDMPAHLSLVRFLRERGYATHFCTGVDGHFENIDVFMERQGVDRFSDQTSFPPGIAKQPGAAGFSWGYADQELFRNSLDQLGPTAPEPRLDVYLTITTHEPFIPPSQPAYHERYLSRMASLDVSEDKRRTYAASGGVFETLLYLDDSIRWLLEEYARRPEYARTIFVITGDHRLIPIPFSTRISRYRVPFIVFSPLVKAPHTFSSVSSHQDVAPTVAAYLAHNHGLELPDRVPWVGTGIDSTTSFRNTHGIVLMRTRSEMDDYLLGERFLSGDQLFAVEENLDLVSLDRALRRQRQLSRYATSGDHIYPETAEEKGDRQMTTSDDAVFRKLRRVGKRPEEQLAVARARAEAKDYEASRAVLRHVLRTNPMYHDARALLGRTYAYETRFEEARGVLDDLAQRAPGYLDEGLASIDVEIFDSEPAVATELIDRAIAEFGLNADLLFNRTRALELQGRKREALAALDSAIALRPGLDGAAIVRARLSR